ncbi:hypothetical protein [Halobellus sp. EA9]|uniref:hypothetical protein n=1 Tax=Halobellus sp. EA9 TaxID=3421647 RepID=UPI003EB96520
MAAIGVVVLVHGAVLLTSYASRLRGTNGPLMIGYAAVMLLLQALSGAGMTTMGGSGPGSMNGGMADGGMMGESAISAGMGWDAGMVFLALLMLVSGGIMTRERDSTGM